MAVALMLVLLMLVLMLVWVGLHSHSFISVFYRQHQMNEESELKKKSHFG